MRIPKSIAAIAAVCDSGSSRYALAGVQVGRENKKPFAVATDGRRLIHVTWTEDDLLEFKDEPPPDSGEQRGSIIVPAETFKEMAAMCNGARQPKGVHQRVKRVYLDESNGEVVSRFTNHELARELKTRAVEGKFPKWKDVITNKPPLASVKFRGALLLSTLKAVVSALELSGDNTVTIELHEDKVHITAEKDGKQILAVLMGKAEG